MDLEKYIPLLYKIANKFDTVHRDDLIQEGFLEMEKCSKKYDPEKDSPFETFAYKRIYFCMVDYLKAQGNNVSLDEEITDEEGNTITRMDLLEDNFDLGKDLEAKDLYSKSIEASSKREAFIKKRFFENGMQPQQIVDLYSELLNIRDVRTIKKIIKQ